MTALISKEWRENVKWLPLPSLIVVLVFLVDRPDGPMFDATDMYFLCLIPAVFGAALGFVQVYFEGHGDKRSLLLHRPLSPSRIFLAKVLAGFSLYVLALGIPFVCLELWMSTPGKLPAPFDWRTSLPWLADILSGLVYYFAGMLVAQREGRWYGSRCLPLAAAFCCSYLAWAVPEFWQALGVIGLIGSFMGVAAWGSFAAGGGYGAQPRLAKAALAATLLAGLLIVSALGKQKIGEWLDAGIDYEYALDRQGHVVFQSFKEGVGVLECADLSGRAVPELGPMDGGGLVWTATPYFWSYRNSGRFYVKCSNDSKPDNERWYYDHARGRLFGYDVFYNQCLGSFGPNGFAPAGEPANERFPGELRYRCAPTKARPSHYLVFPGCAYAVDFARRTIRTLFAAPTGETLSFVDRWSDPLNKKRCGLVASTDRSLHFLTTEGADLACVPRLYDPVEYVPLLAGRLENPERYCVVYPSWFPWASVLEPEVYRNLEARLHEYDLAGREVSRRTLPPIPYQEASPAQALFGLATPLTEAASLVGASRYLRAQARLQGGMQKPVLLHDLDNTRYWIPETAPDKATPSGLIPAYLALLILAAAACALAGCLLARRYSFSRGGCSVWTLCGFLFGWVGLVLMLALHEWPARIRCAKCGKLRVVTREACEHCGALHVTPAPDGTEIFEPAATVPSLASISETVERLVIDH
jgi:hypothetical protein